MDILAKRFMLRREIDLAADHGGGILLHRKKSPAALFSDGSLVSGGKKRRFCRLPRRVATPGRSYFQTFAFSAKSFRWGLTMQNRCPVGASMTHQRGKRFTFFAP